MTPEAAAHTYVAGAKLVDGKLVTSGGRVTGTTAVADSLEQAIAEAYRLAGEVQFDNAYLRSDIGARALQAPVPPATWVYEDCPELHRVNELIENHYCKGRFRHLLSWLHGVGASRLFSGRMPGRLLLLMGQGVARGLGQKPCTGPCGRPATVIRTLPTTWRNFKWRCSRTPWSSSTKANKLVVIGRIPHGLPNLRRKKRRTWPRRLRICSMRPESSCKSGPDWGPDHQPLRCGEHRKRPV